MTDTASTAPPDQGRPSDVAFDNVGLRYPGGDEVLRSITFNLAAGSFHFLTGPSGAGKSTLLKLIYLALRPSKGSVHLFGRDVASLARDELPAIRRRIGVVFQEFRLLNHLSAFENVALPLRVAGMRSAGYRADVEELLRWVGLGERIHAKPPTLSGGEQQRVAIARAVVAKPKLLLADEPTGNVDPDMADKLIRLLIELNRLGTTVIVASHDRRLVEKSGAPVLELKDARLTIRSGRP